MLHTLGKRILLFVCVVLLATLAVNDALIIQESRNGYRDSLIMRCRNLAANLKGSIEKVLALGIQIREIEGLDLRCQQIAADDPEIVYCLIEDPRGKLLFSSQDSPVIPANMDFLDVTGETATALFSHPDHGSLYDISIPIKNSAGTIVARLRVGFPDSVLSEMTRQMLRHTLMVFALAAATVFAVVAYFIRRDVIGPIHRLCTVAGQIAGGDFRVVVPEMKMREFNQLGHELREMASSLQQRDDKIQDSYAELELANRELLFSYEQQEKISIELASSREMYRALLEHASDAILVIDDNDQVVLANHAAEAFFGLTRPEVEGKNFFIVLARFCGERIEQEYETFQKLRSGSLTEAELNFFHPESGAKVVGWVRGSVISGSDQRKMVQLTIRDVTRDREIKENLEQLAADLQTLNKMKSSFLGMASHELKTPLTVISGYSELILTDMTDRVDPAVLDMVRYISDASERLTTIVRDMIDVTQLDQKQVPLRRRPVDLNDLVRSATREMEYFFHVRNQQILYDLATELPPVDCDPDRIFQVVTNLVGNAVKFTPDHGSVTVATRLVHTRRAPGRAIGVADFEPIDQKDHPYVELIVKDNGIGIDAREQIQIFEKFYEVGKIEEHFTGKMAFKGRGTGLGLTIVKGMVDRHGGAIWVESAGHDPESCPGSAFHVILPLHPPPDHPE